MLKGIGKIWLWFPPFLLAYLVISPKAVFAAANPDLSCKVHTYLVDDNYQLPYHYDTYEVTQGSKLNPGNNIVYTFEIQSASPSSQKTITQVVAQHVNQGSEPIEIKNVRPQNGSCTTDPQTKAITCNLNYTFFQNASGPIEYLFKIADNPQKVNTSTLFYVVTDSGSTSCASMHFLNSVNKPNPVNFATPFASFKAADFYIQIGNQKFFGKEPISVHSDPNPEKPTLEMSWQENGVEMRLYFYFQKNSDGTNWQLYDLRTYNGQFPGDWIHYDVNDYPSGYPISYLLGQPNHSLERTIKAKGGTAQIYCKDCYINAFMPQPIPVSQGYYLEALIGLPAHQMITLTTNPNQSYGVNFLLRDNKGQIVTDQSGFDYAYEAMFSGSYLQSSPIPYSAQTNSCLYGILSPCPQAYLSIKGLAPSQGNIEARVVKKGTTQVVARTSFPVKITAETASQQLLRENRDRKVAQLQQQVNELTNQVNQQQSLIDQLNQTINNLLSFFFSFFGR